MYLAIAHATRFGAVLGHLGTQLPQCALPEQDVLARLRPCVNPHMQVQEVRVWEHLSSRYFGFVFQ